MGLDQYAYVAAKARQQAEYETEFDLWVDEGSDKTEDEVLATKPREIAYWRKHPNLHGWMEALWVERNPDFYEQGGTFNGIELELTWEDLERLEQDVLAGTLPVTTGFFFGSAADDYYRDYDLQFIRNAKAEVFVGLKMFYNSSW
jgi:hypothetical protein